MTYSRLRLELDGGIARLTLDRPAAANTIDLEMARELMLATLELAADRSVRVVVLTGAGRVFCAGGDLKSFQAVGDGLDRHLGEVTAHLHAAVSRLARLPVPVVAGVQGSAAGAGLGLACVGDLVVAAESARFLMAYRDVGLSPDGAATWLLPRLVGLRRALELSLTSRALSAAEAQEWGLVTEVVPDDELSTRVDRLAEELAEAATAALGRTRLLLRASVDDMLETQMERESSALAASAWGDDAREGIAAFLEKRPPRFVGR